MAKDWKKIAEEYGGTYYPPTSDNMGNTTQENSMPIKKDWKKIAEEYGGTYQEEPKSLLNKFVTTPFRGIAPMVARPMYNIADRASKDIFAGSGYLVHNLLNAPAQLARAGADLGIVSHEAAEHVPYGQPKEYDFSKLSGIENPNLIDTIIQGATQYAPYAILGDAVGLTKAIKPLSSLRNIVGEAATGGIFGATQSPDVGEGAITGAIAGAAIPAAIGAAKKIPLIKNLIPKSLQSSETSSDIHSFLADKNKNAGEARQSLAGAIKESYEQAKKPWEWLYNEIEKRTGNDALFDKKNFSGNNRYVDKIRDFDTNLLSSNSKELNKNYMENPNFHNAHFLQSQLGYDLRNKNIDFIKSPGERDALNKVKDLRKSLKSDIYSFLQSKNPSRADIYDKVSQEWIKHVVPYYQSNTLEDIISGNNTNPSQAHIRHIFSYPEGIKSDAADLNSSTGTYRILDDIKNFTDVNPEKSIYFTELHNLKGKALAKKIDSIYSDNALNSYAPKELQSLKDALENSLTLESSPFVKYPKAMIENISHASNLRNIVRGNTSKSNGGKLLKRNLYKEAMGTTLANYLNPDYNR